MSGLRFMAVGDVVGPTSLAYVKANLWDLRKENDIDCVILNGENACVGNGIDVSSAKILLDSGVDVVTMGNHVWHKREIYTFMDESKNIIRPANYPSAAPGMGYTIIGVNNYRVLVMNLLGNVFMEYGLESPFVTADKILEREEGNFDFGVIDIHAEATSEKIALAKYLDGKKSPVKMVFGTHTHVQTNDAKVLRNGTGYITDIGMTGGEDSVLGVKTDAAIQRFLTKMPVKFETESENIVMEYVIFDIDTTILCAESVKAYRK